MDTLTVSDIWEKYEGKRIRLGTEKGSAFIWMGIVGDEFISDMVHLGTNYRKFFDSVLAKAKDKVEKMSKLESYWMQEPERFFNSLNELDRARESLAKAKVQRKACTNICKREVVREYPTLDLLSDTTIVIIKGYESGSAWCEDEWNGLYTYGKVRWRRKIESRPY